MCAPPENDEKIYEKADECRIRRAAVMLLRTKLSYHIHYNIEQDVFQAILRCGAVELFCIVLVILHTNERELTGHLRGERTAVCILRETVL
jgi:hypothetical protein